MLPVAPPVFAYWQAVPRPRRAARAVRLVLSGSAPLSPELVDAFTARTGIPVHQGYGLTEAAPVVTSTLCSRARDAGLGRRRAARHRDPAGRRRRPHPRGRRTPGEIQVRGRQPVQRLLARRRGRPRRGRLVRHRRRRLPRRRRRPVPGRPAQGARDRLRVQRLPGRGRGRRRRGRRGRRGRGDRHRRTRATGEAVVAYVARRPVPTRRELESAVREHCAVRLARFKQPTEVEVVDELPLHGDRQGAEGPAAGQPSAPLARAART